MSMTAKERQQLERLQAENRELRAKLDQHLAVYRDQAMELIDLRARLALVRAALADPDPV